MPTIREFTITEDEIICDDRYLEIASGSALIDYIKTDYFYIGPFSWWRGIPMPGKAELGNRVLITGQSDYVISEEIYNQCCAKYRYWFAPNVAVDRPGICPVPLGISNYNVDKVQYTRVMGNRTVMMNVLRLPFEKTLCAYMNFSIHTNPVIRQPVWDMFSGRPWIMCGGPIDCTDEAREAYLRDMYHSKFTICPQGNGPDTFRMWEALYMKSIPIVKRHVTHKNMDELPILFIDDWSEVTEELLESVWEEYSRRDWNMRKLCMSYWRELIHACCA